MVIKEAKFKNVMVKQRKCVSEAIYGCDECKTEIKGYPIEENRLVITVFQKNDARTKDLHFCSWDCVFNHLPKVKSDYFVSLPHVYYDISKGSKRGAEQLIKFLRKK